MLARFFENVEPDKGGGTGIKTTLDSHFVELISRVKNPKQRRPRNLSFSLKSKGRGKKKIGMEVEETAEGKRKNTITLPNGTFYRRQRGQEKDEWQ